MKRIKYLLMTIAMMVYGVAIHAQGTIFSNFAPTGQMLWYFQANEAVDSVWVVAPNAYDWGTYTKPTGNLVIPDSVVRYGTTYYVQGILAYAFKECSGLRSVVISNGIPTIGIDAFNNCTGMTDITFGSQTKLINSSAFKNCSRLEWIKSRADFILLSDSTVFEGVSPTIPVYVPCNRGMFYNALWSHFSNYIETIPYTVTATADYSWKGTVEVTGTPTCDSAFIKLYAQPNSNYHFESWNDGNTDNPRVVELTSDTSFVANFAHGDLYTITVVAADPTMGTVSGSGVYEAYTAVSISATPFSGYRFVRWHDGYTRPERTVYALQDTTYTAFFESTQGIADMELQKVRVTTVHSKDIVVSGADGKHLKIYDAMGRMVVNEVVVSDESTYKMPSAGLYLVQIDALMPKKVMVR